MLFFRNDTEENATTTITTTANTTTSTTMFWSDFCLTMMIILQPCLTKQKPL